ncbi:helix-turn-helix domain-containing protein [Anaerostipes caccae]|uniref:helix-turn-helix domain-containing protein n=1 Tax=Anaerostipes caccae TaxID=105841 RepID=UPI001D08AC69|nr:helix-turn-helix transcriptional regulator [Anaerostipes caccae]DAE59113.1 MAG TPA: SOS-response transcriptional repressor [Caudoviricetes sp.]MCB6293782.1 helix-turn-helix transcriptional regulator [Anaerostipes caccae]MCB6336465.1 helix-turn-helix transcriptional regulator [Anaerostipes caccae]MCB6339569.1 helix-turn-helix transcriptional regulator [Anaerostipes caccae]MCB6351505.1 helix-turn-helix transcriptional regulator [Anaerostipes caccae]
MEKISIEQCNYPVAENAARLMDEKMLKRKAVAKELGYSEQMLSDMLNGRKLIKVCDILLISNVLRIEVEKLFQKIDL